MHDRIVTLEQDTQACATDATVENGGEDQGRELRNRTGVQLQTRRESYRSSELGLRFRQNEALSIYSLTTELLLQVIHHHMRPYSKDLWFDYYERLISLTGVCSRWCDVIRDSSSLWNRIHWSDSSEVVEIALRRSSNQPLDIVLYTMHFERELEYMSWLMNALGKHRDRWRSMDISVQSRGIEDIIDALEKEPAPSLERLSFTKQDTTSGSEEDFTFSTKEFDFFRGSAPRLTELTLNGISLRWDSQVIQDLTVLDLQGITFLSTNTILGILSHSPRLWTVAIYRCTAESIANAPFPPIPLPHLTSLRLDLGGLDAAEDVLGHIEASERCSLAKCFQSHETDENIGEFLQQRLRKWMSKWKYSALVPFEGLLLEIDGSDLRVELTTTDSSEPLALAIDIPVFSWVAEFREVLPQLIDTLESLTKGLTTVRLMVGYPPSGYHEYWFKQEIIEQVSRLSPITSLETSLVGEYTLLDGLIFGDVSSLFRNIRTLSLKGLGDYELHDSLDWMCEAVQIAKDATKSP